MTEWEIKGREFGNCNCAYGCPCQFNALPTHGHCHALAVYDIERGFHGSTRLDGLKAAAIFRWPGPIHEGKGECVYVLDRRGTPEQRAALLRIVRGEDTEPGATMFHVFVSTCDTLHEPIIADFAFEMDIDARTASARIDSVSSNSTGCDRPSSTRCAIAFVSGLSTLGPSMATSRSEGIAASACAAASVTLG